jgi:hypothetical protein
VERCSIPIIVVILLLLSLTGLNNQKKECAVFLSHWSLLSELSYCFVKLGKVYLLQGAVREAKRFLKDGREITRRFLSANRWLPAFYVLLLTTLLLKLTLAIFTAISSAILFF